MKWLEAAYLISDIEQQLLEKIPSFKVHLFLEGVEEKAEGSQSYFRMEGIGVQCKVPTNYICIV